MNIRPIRTPEGGLRYEAYVAPQRVQIRELMAADRERQKVRWQRVNGEPFEYAIGQGRFGDEFVKLADGSCLRRPISRVTWGDTLVGLVCGGVLLIPIAYFVGIYLLGRK